MEPDDYVVLPSADAELTLAVAELCERRQPASLPRFSIRLMYDDVGQHATSITITSALKRLMQIPEGSRRVRLYAETKAFADHIESLTGWPTEVMPHPTQILRRNPASVAKDERRFVLFSPGKMRLDKGTTRIDRVVDALSTQYPALAARTILRVQGQGLLHPKVGVRVETLAEHLPLDDYAAALGTSHAALLLHDPEIYARRGSGAVCDSVAAKRPFVCLAGTSLVAWMTDGNGIAATDLTSITAAIATIAKDTNAFLPATVRASERLTRALAPPLLGVEV
jgi:hypothetical protein